jgi:hypoxanthine-guanine phosphoribosyltransferase
MLAFRYPIILYLVMGLDLDEYYRNLPFIGTINPQKYHSKS